VRDIVAGVEQGRATSESAEARPYA
jgi:hypothetical protein